MITSAPNSLVRRLRAPGYLVLGTAMVFPLVDWLVPVLPLRPLTIAWRFGAVGYLSSAMGAPLLVLFLFYALAYFSGDRKVMVLCAVLAGLIALSAIAGAGTFALDALQMKSRVQAPAQSKFLLVSGWALCKLAIEGLASLVLVVNVVRNLRNAKTLSALRSEARTTSSLLMGRAQRPVSAEMAVIPPTPNPNVEK